MVNSQQLMWNKFTADVIFPKLWNNYLRFFCHKGLKNIPLLSQKVTFSQESILYVLTKFSKDSNTLRIHSQSTQQIHFSPYFKCKLDKDFKIFLKKLDKEGPKQQPPSFCIHHGTTFVVPIISHYGYDTSEFYLDCTYFKYMHCFPAYSTQLMHVFYPSGQLSLEYPDRMMTKLPFVICSRYNKANIQTQSVVWFFSVQKKFSLNFTFTTMYFSKRVRMCIEGNLTIVESFQKPQKSAFVFCEHHASFSIYPRCSGVTISVTIFPLISSKIILIHTLIDKSLFTSRKERNLVESPMEPFSVLVRQDNCTFMTFFLSVRKTLRAIIDNINQTTKEMFAFDGPDSLSTEINTNRKTIRFSTFQGLLQVKQHLVQLLQACHLIYTSIAISRQLNLQFFSENHQEYFVLPGSMCAENICLIVSSSFAQSHINMSILSFSVSNQQIDSCVFGALLTIEDFDNNHIESRPLCDKDTSISVHRRSLYSYGTNMTTVLFWYKHKCEFNISIVFSLTSCQHVQFSQCSTYSRQEQKWMEKISGFDLVGGKSAGLFANVPPGRCLIVQFLPVNASNLFWNCITKFKIQRVESYGFKVIHTVKGYFAAPLISRKFSFCCNVSPPRTCQKMGMIPSNYHQKQ